MLFGVLTAGCEYFLPPEAPPADRDAGGETTLRCGGSPVSVTGMVSGDEVSVEVSGATSIQIQTLFATSGHAGRLRVEAGEIIERTLELWDSVSGRRVLPALLDGGGTVWLELIALDGAALQGSVSMECTQPVELCSDLSDNDADGATDCADLDCARDDGCEGGQEDFLVVPLDCTGDPMALGPTALTTFDDQRLLYLTSPGGAEAPPEEFWGGAEIVFTTDGSGTLSLDLPAGGLLCAAPQGSGSPIACEAPQRIAAAGSTTVVLTPGQALWLEPLAAGWESITATFVCDGTP